MTFVFQTNHKDFESSTVLFKGWIYPPASTQFASKLVGFALCDAMLVGSRWIRFERFKLLLLVSFERWLILNLASMMNIYRIEKQLGFICGETYNKIPRGSAPIDRLLAEHG